MQLYGAPHIFPSMVLFVEESAAYNSFNEDPDAFFLRSDPYFLKAWVHHKASIKALEAL